MLKRASAAIVLAATTYASPSLAGIGFELFGGARSGKMEVEDAGTATKKDYDVKGNEFGATLYYSPMHLPLQFGLIGSYYTLDSSKAYEGGAQDLLPSGSSGMTMDVKGKITGMHYGAMVRAWLPFGFVQPYAEAGYVMGSQTEKVDYTAGSGSNSMALTSNGSYDTKGPLAGLGLRIAPLPLFAVTIGYQMTMEERQLTKADYEQSMTTGGNTTAEKGDLTLTDADKKSHAFTTGAIRLGFSLGF